MAVVFSWALCLSLLLAVALAEPVPIALGSLDFKAATKALVSDIREMASRAKAGVNLDELLQLVTNLQGTAVYITQHLPGQVSECQINLIVKMAATGTGSHEMLTVLLADDGWSVLSGRLSLSLAFLDNVARQLEDELSLSDEVGAHLAAILFGTNITASIINTADETAKSMKLSHNSNDNHISDGNNDRVNRVKRQIDLGSWSFGITTGLTWRRGRSSFDIRPLFGTLLPNGFSTSLRLQF